MPEGPELHLASKFVNACCKGLIFSGKVVKNPVHKSCDVAFESPAYTISATSRGKEMQLILTKLDCSSGSKRAIKGARLPKDAKKIVVPESVKILFRFGMSGNFQFTTPEDIHKHSHLRFFTKDEPKMVLSYVDVRRFGRWEVGADWSKDRGPDPMFEYQLFRSNVINNLHNAAFDQPICETMLNQKYFNGIGNYLRAEILYRLCIPPFEKARSVFEGLREEPPDVKPMRGGKGKSRKGEEPDLLHLCHTVPLEVIDIGAGGYTADGKASDYSDFMKWLQCYYQDGMHNMVDHNGRTIWFAGPTGPMVPKDGKSRNKKSPTKRKQSKSAGDDESTLKVTKEEKENSDNQVKKMKKTRRTQKATMETYTKTQEAALEKKRGAKGKRSSVKKENRNTKTKTKSSTQVKKEETCTITEEDNRRGKCKRGAENGVGSGKAEKGKLKIVKGGNRRKKTGEMGHVSSKRAVRTSRKK